MKDLLYKKYGHLPSKYFIDLTVLSCARVALMNNEFNTCKFLIKHVKENLKELK